MKYNIILLIANFALTLVIGGYLLYQSGASKNAPNDTSSEPITVTIDNHELAPQIEAFNENLDNLSSTIHRFNTSLIQYDFLKEEMSRLAEVDRTIGLRAQATSNAKKNTEVEEELKQADDMIQKLSKLSQQVKGQHNARRQTMLKLITGLERELQQASLPEGSQLPTPKSQPQPSPKATESTSTPPAKTSNEE